MPRSRSGPATRSNGRNAAYRGPPRNAHERARQSGRESHLCGACGRPCACLLGDRRVRIRTRRVHSAQKLPASRFRWPERWQAWGPADPATSPRSGDLSPRCHTDPTHTQGLRPQDCEGIRRAHPSTTPPAGATSSNSCGPDAGRPIDRLRDDLSRSDAWSRRGRARHWRDEGRF